VYVVNVHHPDLPAEVVIFHRLHLQSEKKKHKSAGKKSSQWKTIVKKMPVSGGEF
jgi:hypothetical protein